MALNVFFVCVCVAGESFQALKAMGQDVTEDDVAKMLIKNNPPPQGLRSALGILLL